MIIPIKRVGLWMGLVVLLGGQGISAPGDSSRISRADSVYTPEYFLKFGQFLWEQRDYSRAATEFERYVFLNPHRKLPRLRYRIGLCYYRLGELERALRYFQEAFQLGNAPSLKDSSRLAMAAVYLRRGENGALLSLLSENGARVSRSEIRRRLHLFRAFYFLQMGDWNLAAHSVPDTAGVSSREFALAVRRIRDLARKGRELPYKSPVKAALLSGLLPGGGRFYLGRKQDGFYSLLLITGSALLSYRGYRNHGPAHFQTIFFGSTAALLYLGNIYGSAVAARLHNRQIEERLWNEIDEEMLRWTDL